MIEQMQRALGQPLRVLLVEDNPADARMVRELLKEVDAAAVLLTHAGELTEAVAHLRDGGYNVVLLDLSLPDSQGMATLTRTRSAAAGASIVVLTGDQDEALAVQAVREGAQDYLVKGQVDGRLLHHAIRYAAARHQTSEALRRSEQRYRSLVDASIQAILIHVKGVIRLANPALADLVGVDDPADLVGTTIWEYIAADDQAMLTTNLAARMKGEDAPTRYDFRLVRKDRERRWVECLATSVTWDGEAAIMVTMVDATERVQAVRAMEASERRFRQLAEAMSEVFFIIDADLSETHFVSHAYEEIWGRSVESIYRHPASFLDSVDAEDRQGVLDALTKTRRGEDPGEVVFRVHHPDGATRWVLARPTPIPNEQGGGYLLSGIARDITEHRRAQEALEDSEARFRKLTEASFDGTAIVLDGVVQETNEGFARMFGYRVDEVVGRPALDFVAPESRQVVGEKIRQEEEGKYEFVGLLKDGGRITVEAIAKAHRFQGRPGRVTALRDITSQRMFEEAFHQAHKMEAIGRLAGGVAHDFNNALTVILACSDSMAMGLPEDDPLVAEAAAIKNAARHASTLTRQLLAFSRKQVLEPRVLDINEVVAHADKMLRRVIGEDLELETVLLPGAGRVLADPGQVEQILVNLVVNSRDAMPGGGRLTIETGRVTLAEEEVRQKGAHHAGDYVILSVSDSGVGMDAATQARIFEPFFTTKAEGRGTGLGLAMVYGAVKQSEGFITVWSSPGRGSTFRVYLPATDRAVSRDEADREASLPRGSETILLVEDEPGVRVVTRKVLEQLGYHVLTAEQGRQGLAVAHDHQGPIHVLITDVIMPEMGGVELSRELASRRPETRVLFISGYVDDLSIESIIAEGHASYLQKPFSRGALARAVRDALEGTRESGGGPTPS